MKALVWTEVQKMVWKDVPDPEIQDNEVLIRIEVVGICGSEIEGYLGHNSLRKPPLIMGHEMAGRIEALGSKVSSFSIGQKVTVNPLMYCGQCDRCLTGRYQLCDKRNLIGVHRPGGFGQWLSVPVHCVVPFDDQVGYERISLTEPLACSLRAVRRAFAQGHSIMNVIVIGAGGIGLLCAKAARLLGASQIGMIDTNEDRLKMVENVGAADFTVNAQTDDLKSKISKFSGYKGIDVVIDAAGFQPTRSLALDILNPGGTLMNIGLGIDVTQLAINHAIRSEIDILSSFCYVPKDFLDARSWLVSGKVTEDGWTESRHISTGDQAFQDLTSGKVHKGKILLHM